MVKNKELKNIIIKTIQNAKWTELYPQTTSPNLLQWQVVKYLKEKVPEIK